MNQQAKHVTAIVFAHLLANIAHGLAHRELGVGLPLSGTVFVIVVVLLVPLVAMGLVWTAEKPMGFVLLSLSMSASFLFGLYHHFLAVSPDQVRMQPHHHWGMTFVLTAYLLLITEAIGTYAGMHFLRTTTEASR